MQTKREADLKTIWEALKKQYTHPTVKVRDAFGRFCHVLAAACLIAFPGIGFSGIDARLKLLYLFPLLIAACYYPLMGFIGFK